MIPNPILLTLGAVFCAIFSISLKAANNRCNRKDEVQLFNGCVTLIASILAIVSCTLSGSFFLPLQGIIYAAIFGITFSATLFLQLLALECGSLSVTTLLINFSLLIPLTYSIVAYNEKLTLLRIIGVILFGICMFLFINPKLNDNENTAADSKRPFKWILLTIAALIGNGLLSLIQKIYAVQTDNLYSSAFLMYSYIFATVASVIVVLQLNLKAGQRVTVTYKNYFAPAMLLFIILAGAANFLLNLVIVLLATRVDAMIVYPVVQGCGLMLVAASSYLIFKEKLTAIKIIGIIIGFLALVLLNSPAN